MVGFPPLINHGRRQTFNWSPPKGHDHHQLLFSVCYSYTTANYLLCVPNTSSTTDIHLRHRFHRGAQEYEIEHVAVGAELETPLALSLVSHLGRAARPG